MLKLKLRVPYDSAYVGVLTGTDGVNKISCPASTQFVSAVRRLDLPAGSYRLTKSVPVKQGDRSAVDAYGNTIISFTATDISPMSKPRVIVMHGGKMGNDGLLRPTEGTVRLSDDDLFFLTELIEVNGNEVVLEIEQQTIRFYHKPFRPKVSSSRPLRVASSSRRVSVRSSGFGSGFDYDPVAEMLEDYFWYQLLYGGDEQQSGELENNDQNWPGFQGGESGGAGATMTWNVPSSESAVEPITVPEELLPEEPIQSGGPLFVNPYPPQPEAVEVEVITEDRDQDLLPNEENLDQGPSDEQPGDTDY
mgnify:CR=1 FL=1